MCNVSGVPGSDQGRGGNFANADPQEKDQQKTEAKKLRLRAGILLTTNKIRKSIKKGG